MRWALVILAVTVWMGCGSTPETDSQAGSSPSGSEGTYHSVRELGAYHAEETLGSLADGRRYRVAIPPLELTADGATGELGFILQDELISAYLRERPANVAIYERGNLNQVLAESELALSGMVAEESAAEVGKLIGANAVLIGTVRSMGEDLHVATKLVDTDTAQILSSVTSTLTLPSATGPVDEPSPDRLLDREFSVTELSLDFELAEQYLVHRISTHDGIWREYNASGEEIGTGRMMDVTEESFTVEWTFVPGNPEQVGGLTRYEYHRSGRHMFVRIIVDGYQIGYLELTA